MRDTKVVETIAMNGNKWITLRAEGYLIFSFFVAHDMRLNDQTLFYRKVTGIRISVQLHVRLIRYKSIEVSPSFLKLLRPPVVLPASIKSVVCWNNFTAVIKPHWTMAKGVLPNRESKLASGWSALLVPQTLLCLIQAILSDTRGERLKVWGATLKCAQCSWVIVECSTAGEHYSVVTDHYSVAIEQDRLMMTLCSKCFVWRH